MTLVRHEVQQRALNMFSEPTYLEIGVFRGLTFHAIQAAKKVGVDPDFRFDIVQAKEQDPSSEFHAMTSDQYFAGLDLSIKYDVVYIDGLHTFEQTLRDLMNSISHVHNDSIIIIDDIFPNSLAAALPDPNEYRAVKEYLRLPSKAWMGDVYKVVMFIDSMMQTWDFACVDDNLGQLVMWQSPRKKVDERMISSIGLAGYERAIMERASFKFAPFDEIITRISSRSWSNPARRRRELTPQS